MRHEAEARRTVKDILNSMSQNDKGTPRNDVMRRWTSDHDFRAQRNWVNTPMKPPIRYGDACHILLRVLRRIHFRRTSRAWLLWCASNVYEPGCDVHMATDTSHECERSTLGTIAETDTMITDLQQDDSLHGPHRAFAVGMATGLLSFELGELFY